MPYEMVRLLNSDHPYRYDGTLFGGTKLWTPSQITTALWLDADKPSSITLNGATVSQWNDLSGNGRHATQATASLQPTYTASAINSKPALAFSSDSMSSAADVNGLDALTIYLVITASSVGNYQSAMRFQGAGGYLVYPWSGSATAIETLDAPAGSGILSGFVANAVNVGVLRRERNAANGFAAYNNGSFVAGVTSSNSTIQASTLTIGSFGGVAEFFAGSIGEIIIAYTAHDTATRQKLEGYLAWKWGTQASLPVSHPYYSAPPLA